VMEASYNEDLKAVLAHIREAIGASPNWTEWPGGWRDDIESALLDAVFSARAVYRSKHGRGVHSLVVTWQQKRTRTQSTLSALSAEIDAIGPDAWAEAFGSMQWSPSRHPDSPGGPTKAAAVREAAAALVQANIMSAGDINTENAEKVKTVLRGVDGIGYATSNYFLMLLGAPGVKPDRMIHRFLRDATGRQLSNKYADQVLTAAAEELRTEPHRLEHAIWWYESDKAQRRRATSRLGR
jgi:hypothetical protein